MAITLYFSRYVLGGTVDGETAQGQSSQEGQGDSAADGGEQAAGQPGEDGKVEVGSLICNYRQ